MKANPVRALLAAALALISHPAKWTKGIGARDACGNCTAPYKDSVDHGYTPAVCYCTVGALWAQREDKAPAEVRGVEEQAQVELLHTLGMHHTDSTRIYDWNDAPERTHADVVKLYKDTIARLPEQVAAGSIS